jgi:transposase-like protein
MGMQSQRWSEMRRVVEGFRASGLTRREFCGQRGIELATLDYWRRQFRSKPRLVKVELAQPEAAVQSFTLRLANIDIKPGVQRKPARKCGTVMPLPLALRRYETSVSSPHFRDTRHH